MKFFARTILITLAVVLLVACQTSAPTTAPASTATKAKPETPASTATKAKPETPVSAETVAPDTPSVPAPISFDFAWDDRSPFRTGLIAGEQAALDQLEGASVYHIDLRIADDLVHLEGRQDVRYTNQETIPLDEVYFRLFPNLLGGIIKIHTVQVNDRDVEPAYELADSAMCLPLSPALQPGEQAVIKMTFSVLVPAESGGNYGIFAFVDDILALAHFYPMIAVYDDEGWNLEIPPQTGDVIYADSSFYLVWVTAPAALTIVASGVEIERGTTGDRQQVIFAGGPMRDFYLAASTRYAVVSQQVGETTVNSYATLELVDGAKITLGYAVDALRIYNERFGVYPFTEFDVAGTPNLALGIEYPGMVVIALRLYDLEKGEYPLVYLESTVAHEVGHQWFYSVIGNDQLDEPWIDEAIVQYATLLYFQDLYGTSGAEGFRGSLRDRWKRVDNAEIPIGMPVRAYSGPEYGAIVYGRGPLFVETLAKTMGQETFDAFLRDYYETHKWGIATADSLKGLAESHCNCDLTQLFADWVYGH